MNERVGEWVIRLAFVGLCVTAVWTVFGEDLLALLRKGP